MFVLYIHLFLQNTALKASEQHISTFVFVTLPQLASEEIHLICSIYILCICFFLHNLQPSKSFIKSWTISIVMGILTLLSNHHPMGTPIKATTSLLKDTISNLLLSLLHPITNKLLGRNRMVASGKAAWRPFVAAVYWTSVAVILQLSSTLEESAMVLGWASKNCAYMKKRLNDKIKILHLSSDALFLHNIPNISDLNRPSRQHQFLTLSKKFQISFCTQFLIIKSGH